MDSIAGVLTLIVVNWGMFISGCVGGAAAEVVRVWRVERVFQRPVTIPTAILISVGLILLGGLYASRILETQTNQAAFIAGATLPVSLSTLVGQQPNRSRRK